MYTVDYFSFSLKNMLQLIQYCLLKFAFVPSAIVLYFEVSSLQTGRDIQYLFKDGALHIYLSYIQIPFRHSYFLQFSQQQNTLIFDITYS